MGGLILNCDLAEDESPELTRALLERVDAASICCGVHAGGREVTRAALLKAKNLGTKIGAHPGLPVGGGRARIDWAPQRILDTLRAQLEEFAGLAEETGASFDYVKLHGSLYHLVESDAAFAARYLELLATLGIAEVFTLAGGHFGARARQAGISALDELFADRAYWMNGHLVPRGSPGAVLESVEAVLTRVEAWRKSGQMPTVEGGTVELPGETLCVHADSERSLEMINALRPLCGQLEWPSRKQAGK